MSLQSALRSVIVLLATHAACSEESGSGAGDAAASPDAMMSADAASGAGGTGGGAAAVGGTGAGGFSATGEDPHACVMPRPDPGDDTCLACLLDHCCGAGPGLCIAPIEQYRLDAGGGSCYYGFFGCVQACFEREVSAGSTTESWDIVANCHDECFMDPGSPFPDVSAPGSLLTVCVVGSVRSPDVGADAGAADAAVDRRCTVPSQCEMPQSPCVDECFPSWR